MDEEEYYNTDDLMSELRKISKLLEDKNILVESTIKRELPGTLSYHEAILLLESMKHSFPDLELEGKITEIEDAILLKAGITMPEIKQVR